MPEDAKTLFAPRILLLEDSALDAELIADQLKTLEPKPRIIRAASRVEFALALEADHHDIILSDFSLPDFDGMAALDLVVRKAPETPFIFVSGVLGEDAAIDAFRRGATDYVLKQRLARLPAAVERALAEAHERNQRRKAERQRELLVRELSHRVKNNMAVMLSLIRRTAKTAKSVPDFERSLATRVQALADGHALLFENNWNETDFRDVLARAAAAFDGLGERVIILPSPTAHVSPRIALSLAMVFNELYANAWKYGALSGEDGRVEASWTVTLEAGAQPQLLFRWTETNGPRVAPPVRDGFGSKLIRSMIEYELEGRLDLLFPPEGLECSFSFPLSDGAQNAQDAPSTGGRADGNRTAWPPSANP